MKSNGFVKVLVIFSLVFLMIFSGVVVVINGESANSHLQDNKLSKSAIHNTLTLDNSHFSASIKNIRPHTQGYHPSRAHHPNNRIPFSEKDFRKLHRNIPYWWSNYKNISMSHREHYPPWLNYSYGFMPPYRLAGWNDNNLSYGNINFKKAKISVDESKYTPHAPIRINSNADFTSANGVIGGNGTRDDPYIISGWKIDAHGSNYGIYVGNVSKYFIIENCSIFNFTSYGYQYPYTYYGGAIILYNSENGILENNLLYENYGVGIMIAGSMYVSIKDNEINNSLEAIEIIDGHNNTVKGNEIHQNGDTIGLSLQSSNNEIINNNITDNYGFGITLDSGTGNRITNNVIENNTFGVSLTGMFIVGTSTTENNIIDNNTIAHNKFYGIGIRDSSHTKIYDNNVSNNGCHCGFPFEAGIWLWAATYTSIFDNKISNNGGEGILVAYSQFSLIKDNVVINNGIVLSGDESTFSSQEIINNTVNGKPVYYYKNGNMENATVPEDAGEVIVGNVSWLTLSDLSISNSDMAVEIGYSSNIKIINSDFSYEAYGVFLDNSDNIVIENNTMVYNVYGLDLGFSYNNNIKNNGLYNNEFGIYMLYTYNTAISGNKMLYGGIVLDGDKITFSEQEIDSNNTVNGKPVYYYKNENMENATVPEDAGEVIVGNVSWLNMENLSISYTTIPIEIGYSSHITVQNNRLDYNIVTGIMLSSSSGNYVKNNELSYNANDIYLSFTNETIISGNKASKSINGLVLISSKNNTIKNNALSYNGAGLFLNYYSNNNIMENNSIIENQYGIYLYDSIYNVIGNNKFLANKYSGVYIYYGSYSSIFDNEFVNNTYSSIVLMDSYNETLRGNTMVGNGILVTGDKEAFVSQEIINNTVNGKPVYYYKNGNMENTTVPEDAGEVILGNVSWLRIENLNISHSTVGMEIGYSYHIIVKNNNIAYNSIVGILVLNSNNTLIMDNNVSHSINGIVLLLSNNNNIVENDIEHNKNGTYLTASDYNVLDRNKITNNTLYGVYMEGSSKNTIMRNLIYKNGYYGVYLDSESSYNLIFDNFFYYNHGSGDSYNSSHVQAYDAGSGDRWSVAMLGNYWRDWASNSDQNNDGIVDLPYKIDGPVNAKDVYPLKYPVVASAPSKPLELKARSGNEFVNLSWSAPEKDGGASIEEYRVYRNGTLIATVSANQLWYNDTNVKNGVNYTYYVTAVNAVGKSKPSNMVNVTPMTVPGSPENLHAVAGNRYVNLSWEVPEYNGGSAVIEYKVYRNGVLIATVSANQLWYNDTSVENGVNYTYYVTAVNSAGESKPSNMVTATPMGLPSPPQNLQAKTGNGYVNLSWEIPTNNGGSQIRGYRVYRNGSLIVTISATQLWYNDTEVVNGENYSYYVTAVNSVGESKPSNTVYAIPMTVPTPPQNLVADAGNGYVLLNWQAPSSNGGATIIKYKIYRGTFSGSEFYIAETSSLCYNDTSVTNGQTYYYYVTAVNSAGESKSSNMVTATPMGLPSPPQNLQAKTGNGYVNLSWEIPTNNGGSQIRGYRVYRNGSLIVTISATQLWYNDTEVVNGENYSYYVTAVNSVGESKPSNTVYAIPMTVPTPPQNLVADAGNGYVNLSWNASVDDGGSAITEYKIYRNGTLIATVPATQLWYNDTNVVNGVNYTYYVTAVNSVGESKPSNEISAIPTAAFKFLTIWIILIVIIIVVAMAALIVVHRMKGKI